jgi:DeoR/GlpR family transcriptional regulator of sugar metabolism
MLAEARRAAIVEMLRAHGSVRVADVQAQLGVSPMTARRDLVELSRRGMALRTHGGAMLPSIAAQEDSFAQRLEEQTEAKGGLADAAVRLLSPRDAVFLDSSTTSYYVARRVVELGLELTLVTNSLPVMQLIGSQAPPNIELVAVGGILRKLTQSFVGPTAVRAIQGHFTDHAFVSIKAVTAGGILADPDPLEAEVKRVMIEQATDAVLLIDRSKLAARGLHEVGPIARLSRVLAYGLQPADLRRVQQFGVPVTVVGEATRAESRPAGRSRPPALAGQPG